MAKINLNTLLLALDKKDRDFYDNLPDEDKKECVGYLNLRWSSCVTGMPELSKYYLMATNQFVNKQFFSLSKHPKLQWLVCTTVSPGMGKQHHAWIKPIGRHKKCRLASIFPTEKMEDLELMESMMDEKELIAGMMKETEIKTH